MSLEVIHEVKQFLYREARLLDDLRFHDWLELFAEDVHYWMPVRSNLYPKMSKAIHIVDRDRYVEDQVSKEDELALLDENLESLRGRIACIDTGMAWAEDPPSRTRHIITNIEVEPRDSPSEVQAYSNFMVYRNRAETEQEFYIGSRQDVLRRVDGAWKIARRKIVLEQSVMLAKNVSIFF
jgi:3-phenylpropionate/cinnamic acid dioxygenase small subunit